MKKLNILLIYIFLTSQAIAEETTEEKAHKENTSPFEVIQVIAQKRLQNVEDVSISISALSGKTISNLGMSTTHEIASQVAGVSISDISGTPNNVLISIRGASQNDFGDHNESPNGVYIDEAYIGAIGGVGIQLFDLDRVEILRGPQGTLFGRNSTGGLVHFITKKPSSENDGYVEVEYGSFNKNKIEGAFGGGDNILSGRISGQYITQDGYIKNRIGKDMLAFERQSLRGQLLYSPNNDLTVLLKTSYSKTDDQPGATYEHQAAIADPNIDHGRGIYFGANEDKHGICNGCDFFNYVDTDGGDVWTSDIDFTDAITLREIEQHTARVEWNSDNFNLISITDFQNTEKTYEEDCDGSSVSSCIFGTYQDTSQFSQELRLEGETEKIDWVIGTNYLNLDGDYEIHLWIDAWAYYASSEFSLETTSYAIFGQFEYEISEDLMFTGGARWTRDEREFSFLNRLLPGADPKLSSDLLIASFSDSLIAERATNEADCLAKSGTFSVDAEMTDWGYNGLCTRTDLINTDTDTDSSNYSLKAALDYQFSDQTMVYASFTRGTKGGGYSAPYNAVIKAENFSYDDEIILNYEMGFKATLFDDTTFFTGAFFYADYQDYQAFDLQGLTQVINNQDAYLNGSELELLVKLDSGWSFNFGLSILEAKVKDYVLPDGSISDTHLPQAPNFTFNGLVHKQWPLAQGAVLSAQIDVLVTGSQYYSVPNHQTTYEDGYTVGNARLSYLDSSGKWETSLWVKNITEEKYATYGFEAAADLGYSFLSFAPPRTFGLSFKYKFQG